MPEIKEIIWDADNTIWNWVRYATKAYPAMADEIARQTRKPVEAVEKGMKTYYTRTGTIESPWLIQDLQRQSFFEDLGWDQNRINQLRDDVHQIFKDERTKHFRMYRGIGDILKTTRAHNIINHIVTDAPAPQARLRLKRSNLHKYITDVYALKFHDEHNEAPDHIKAKEAAGEYHVPFTIYELDAEKPDTRLEDITHAMGEKHGNISDYIRDHVAIIGDNPKKDMALARKYGCLGIQADWGKPTPEELAILARFAPEKVVRKNTSVWTPDQEKSSNIILIEDHIKERVLAELQLAA